MTNLKKIIALTALTAFPLIANATFTAYYPLEVKVGGSLPDGSISIGDGNQNTDPTDPVDPTDPADESKCEFSNSPVSMIAAFKVANAPFAAGDMIYVYNNNYIGFYSPSNGLTPPSGITNGENKSNSSSSMEFEICGSDLSSYPSLPLPTGTPPVDDEESGPVIFTETITYNDCPEARTSHRGACDVAGQNINQNISLQLDDTSGFIVFTDLFSSEDQSRLSRATTISTSTGKSCSIDRNNTGYVGCYNQSLILESEVGSTITFTIK
ncbi:hypothetical protein [Pseudomonas sp. HY7a-MNA-CIBAN-0227]|uniref:hypothetical protein n=1 Tax=Pseudomonas sp. HY7a-MNA-CIBAN-0227 TaxID=3140474 RepID=UPI00331A9F60